MVKLGTFTTIETPTKQEKEALDFLTKEFDKIGGLVRQVLNPHDFGSYPSFEIDYPYVIQEIIDNELSDDDELNKSLDYIKKDEWHDKANQIESNYSKKFEKYL